MAHREEGLALRDELRTTGGTGGEIAVEVGVPRPGAPVRPA